MRKHYGRKSPRKVCEDGGEILGYGQDPMDYYPEVLPYFIIFSHKEKKNKRL